MTEVYLSGLTNQRIDFNDQELEFYRDEKVKQAYEVRECFKSLQQFSLLSKKQRNLYDFSKLWKNLMIVSKILGYQTDFDTLDKFHLPSGILIQELLHYNDLFIFKQYQNRAIIDRLDSSADKYYILMEGIVERQFSRSSISKCQRQSNRNENGHNTCNSSSRFRKNNKRRYSRSQDQIPICLNSYRSEIRKTENKNSTFITITKVKMFQINCTAWKKYLSQFKKMKQQYLINFIRKRLCINLNILKQDDKDKLDNLNNLTNSQDQLELYSTEEIKQKQTLQLNQANLIILYEGQMLIKNRNFKIETSQGCVLNPDLVNIIRSSSNQEDLEGVQVQDMGVAIAKSDVIIIKISMNNLIHYFKDNAEDFQSFQLIMANLQLNRQIKKSIETNFTQIQTVSLFKSKLQNNKKFTERMINYFKDGQSQQRLSKKINDLQAQHSKQTKSKSKSKLNQIKSTESKLMKKTKAPQIIQKGYQKKNKNYQSKNTSLRNQQFVDKSKLLPESIFKDCMSSIEYKNFILKTAVMNQRKDKQNRKQYIFPSFNQKVIQKESNSSQVSLNSLKKKIKQIHIKTQQDQILINYCNFITQRQDITQTCIKERETIGTPLNNDFGENKTLFMAYNMFGKGSRIMKKMLSGKVRRAKFN